MLPTQESVCSILVVDDSSFFRKRVRHALEGTGYVVQEANNGKSALAAIQGETFACILTDLVMPDLDGFGLLAALQSHHPCPPVVVLSADIQKITRLRCQELGAVKFLQKPIDAEALRLALADVISGRS